MDMMAAINARRAQRRAAEAEAARGTRAPTEDEMALANIQRNLKGPGEGVGGVFQILSKGTRTAEFAFNGWRPDSDRRWREVIEVDAGQGGDVDRAIVKRMIELIRGHYQGDFKWESHHLGRTVVLSARPQDNEGLEEFLVREFFGTPTLGRGRRASPFRRATFSGAVARSLFDVINTTTVVAMRLRLKTSLCTTTQGCRSAGAKP